MKQQMMIITTTTTELSKNGYSYLLHDRCQMDLITIHVDTKL